MESSSLGKAAPARGRRRKRLAPEAYLEGILSGDRVRLSKAITLVESSLESDRALAHEVIQRCMPYTGRSYRLGISGVPGVGKSSFIDSFGTMLIEQGKKIAVLAVDPSSALSRGSILGDKTRMNRLSHAPQAFIRPSPTGGTLGGVARNTRETLLLCEAAGYEFILVETVGVGQSEIAVAAMVDFYLVLMLPHAGDELQGIKKGIMEMADGIAINKADGTYLPKARIAKAQYRQALHMMAPAASGWTPQVQLCSALEQTGMQEMFEMLERYQAHCQENGYWEQNRSEQALHWLKESVLQRLEALFFEGDEMKRLYEELKGEVAGQQRSPIQAAELLLTHWRSQK